MTERSDSLVNLCKYHEPARGLLDSYSLATIASDRRPEYLPAMNQIWVPAPLLQKQAMVVLSHEFIHIYTTSFQPSRLLPLNWVLTASGSKNRIKNFTDIVETVCDLHYWLKISLPDWTDIELYSDASSHPELYSELVKISAELAAKASKQITPAAALEQAATALCTLLMHIVPKRPNQGLTIVRTFRDISLPDNWNDTQQLLLSLWICLDKKRDLCKTLKKRFSLAPLVGVHRNIVLTIYFLATAIRTAQLQPHIVTAVFPSLLALLTLGSFVLLPVITLESTKGKYSTKIRVMHTTSRTPRGRDDAAFDQQQAETEERKKGRCCAAVSLFAELTNASKPFRLSNENDRTSLCFETLLSKLPVLVEEHFLSEYNCSNCRLLFSEIPFKSACQTIMNITKDQKAAIAEAVRRYREFLETDAIYYMKKKWRLREVPRPVRAYKFL
jgi:hypothetical protein